MAHYIYYFPTPLGRILVSGKIISSDFEGSPEADTSESSVLTGLWFEGQKYYARTLNAGDKEKICKGADRACACCKEVLLPVFEEAKCWLDIYFSGRLPDFMPALAPEGTPFQKVIWDILLTIPYGQTMTYGQIADAAAAHMGTAHMSAQAVGGAVARNPVSIIIPCHRVIGAGGNLTGYAGGIGRKKKLLELEATIHGRSDDGNGCIMLGMQT